jgi:hypothetical protein
MEASMTKTAKLAFRQPIIIHEHNWLGGLLWVLCAVLALGYIDANDNADQHRRHAKQAQEELRKEISRRPLPESLRSVTFVIEARNHEDLSNKLADIAGAADLERHFIKTLK